MLGASSWAVRISSQALPALPKGEPGNSLGSPFLLSHRLILRIFSGLAVRLDLYVERSNVLVKPKLAHVDFHRKIGQHDLHRSCHVTAPSDPSLTISEAAEQLGWTYRYVRLLIAKGELRGIVDSYTPSGQPRWRLSRAELRAFARRRARSKKTAKTRAKATA